MLHDLNVYGPTTVQGTFISKPGAAVQCWPVLDSVIVFIVRVHLWSAFILLSQCPESVLESLDCHSIYSLSLGVLGQTMDTIACPIVGIE